MSYTTKLVFALVSVYLVWGSTFLGVRIVLNDLTPLLASGIRFTLAGSLMFVYAYLRDQKRPSNIEIRNACTIGFLLNGLGNCATAYGIQYIPSGIVALITSMTPIWIFILNLFLFEKTKPSVPALIGVGLGLIGVIILFNHKQGVTQTVHYLPYFIIIMGSISWAFGSLCSRRITLPKNALYSIALQMFTGGILGLVLSAFFEGNQVSNLLNSHTNTWLSMAYLIFIGSYIGYSSFIWLMKNTSPQLASTYAYVNPIVALLLGVLFLNEPLTPNIIIATMVILLAVILMSFPTMRIFPKRKKSAL